MVVVDVGLYGDIGGGIDAEPEPGQQPTAKELETLRAIADERREAIANLDTTDDPSPEYGDDHAYDDDDRIADGWTEDDPDGIHPSNNDAESTISAESKHSYIIHFTNNLDDGLRCNLSTRSSKLQKRMDVGHAGAEVLIREERHARLAHILMEEQREAIKAKTPREAYRALIYMKQGDYNSTVAPEQKRDEKNSTSTWLARTSHEMIACPWGTVPQQFFFWVPTQDYWVYIRDEDGVYIRDDDGNKVREHKEHVFDKRTVFQELLDVALARFHKLASNKEDREARECSGDFFPLEEGEASDLARKALAVDKGYREADDERQKKSRDSIRKLSKLANSIVSELRFRVDKLRRSCERWHDAELIADAALADAKKGRGEELLRFAIAGWEPKVGELWYQPPDQE